MTLLARNIGVLLGYIFFATINYEYIPMISASIFIVFIILFIWQPNTPRYFIRKGQFQVSILKFLFHRTELPSPFFIPFKKRAENALIYYKGCKGKCVLENLAIHDEMERLKSVESEQRIQEKLRMSDFCKVITNAQHRIALIISFYFAVNHCAMKGLLIGMALVAISHATGHYMLTTYAVMIFKIADSSLLTPYMSSILLALALIFGSLTTTTLADILGRKVLILISLIGSAIGLFAMAVYDYLKLNGYNLSSFTWIPVLSLSLVVFISSAGIIPLSVLVSIENLPPKVRFFFHLFLPMFPLWQVILSNAFFRFET